MDRVLRSKFQHSNSFVTKRPVSRDVDVEKLGGPPSKSVIFDIESGSNTRELSSRNLLGMSIVGQVVRSTSQYGATDHDTSELESIAQKKAVELVRASVYIGTTERFSL